MPQVPVGDIVALVGGKYAGPGDRVISGAAGLAEATAEHLSFLENKLYASQVATSGAGAILVAEDYAGDDPRFIRVPRPRAALADVIDRWFARRPPATISPLASIPASAQIGKNVSIGPFVSIGENATVGDDTILYANVTIYDGCRIGSRVILHSGVVIGADGFGFALEGGRHKKIPHIGIVRVEDDVEIGANSCVDRAVLGETVIGEGTKIDNHVQVGHNVHIGKHCIIVSQVGIAGSAELADYVVVAGKAGIGGHMKIGRGAQITGATVVYDNVAEGQKVIGNPAIPFREYARREMLLKRLLKKRD